MNGKENLLQNRKEVVYSGIMTDGQNRENPNTFDTKERVSGESPAQVLAKHFLNKINDPDKGIRFRDNLDHFVTKIEDEKAWDKLEDLGTDRGVIKRFLLQTATKALLDYDRSAPDRGEESDVDWNDRKNQETYHYLETNMEVEWKKLELLGRNVEVDLNNPRNSELIRSNLENKFIEVADEVFGFIQDTGGAVLNVLNNKYVKVGGTAVGAATILASCLGGVVNPPAEVAIINSTSEATQAPTPTRPDFAGGAYSAEEQALINSGAFKETEDALTAWTSYWANATNNPFHPETTDLHYKYIFDSEGGTAGVCMESTAYDNTCFALPIVDGYALMTPPTASGDYEIPGGFGPLQMSIVMTAEQASALGLGESAVGSILGWENGGWVRVKDGQVVLTLNLESGKYEEVSLIEGDIFQDPQTEADFESVVESPSPIDKPTEFAAWQEEYLRQVEDKLKTWDGTPATLDKVRYNYEGGYITIESEWQTIAAYKFNWKGKEILVKTFVIKDQEGNLVPFSVTYTTNDASIFDKDCGYKTPTGKARMGIRFEWEVAKKYFTDEFIDTFLLDRDKNTDTNVWRSFFAGTGTESDRYKISRMHFVMGFYEEIP